MLYGKHQSQKLVLKYFAKSSENLCENDVKGLIGKSNYHKVIESDITDFPW